MKLLTPTAFFVSTLLLSSCAIFTDKLENKTYTGTVLNPDGTPAVGASVSISSAREYIPVFFLLAPHQPVMTGGYGTTDEKGNYRIEAEISKPPLIFATVSREPNPQIQTPIEYPEMIAEAKAEDGQTLKLIPWEEHLNRKKTGANQTQVATP